MAALAEKLAGLLAPPESVDPSDADALGDETTAGSRAGGAAKRAAAQAADAAPAGGEGGRLRLRPEVPVLEKYKGKKVSRHDAFGEDAKPVVSDAAGGPGPPALSEEEDGDRPPPAEGAASISGGLGISRDLEKEYERMMRQTKQELEVMRVPTSAELQRKEAEAQELKKQLALWNSLVELRIHLEGALAAGHRLPTGAADGAFREASSAVSAELDGVAADVRGLLGTMLEFQQRLAERRGVPLEPLDGSSADSVANEGRDREEAEVWAAVDGRLQSVLDWELGVADEWKERTRLDVRRSFKVLDQSLRSQMQAIAETDAARLRKRCIPPPDRHKVFGQPVNAALTGTAEEVITGEDGAAGKEGTGAAAEGPEQDVFDDRDFYAQLLKEVLASGTKPGEGAKDEAKELQSELQGRRALKKRARAEVERRASKGRKIRYVPIEKLQNFMASRPRAGAGSEAPAWEAAGAVDALLKALFARPGGGP